MQGPLLLRRIALLFAVVSSAANAHDAWTDVATASPPAGERVVTLDNAAWQAAVTAIRRDGAAPFALPLPDGGTSTFLLADSGTMPPEMQRRFPGIVSLAGRDAEGRRARVDGSELGLQVRVFDTGDGWIVAPRDPAAARYAVLRTSAPALHGGTFRCGVDASMDRRPIAWRALPVVPTTVTGLMRRDFRLAVAANSPYVTAVGNGTVSGGLAAVVVTINRVNEVYESEFSIHMTLVADNDRVIYPDPATDPYSNNTNALDENTPNLDKVIGNANYDIGHVFTTASGGVAYVAGTCQNTYKGGGTTGQPNPVGDPFDIDYVAHELGHQFGADHSFNGCGSGSENSGYEPGSGSTIMGYAGICADDDLQPHSDPYFHAKSLQDINRWTLIFGGACAQNTPNANAAPTIAAASLPTGKTIPAHTPFFLTATAADANGDALTYNWEEFDLGAATTLADGDIGNGPILRSYPASTGATRIFPRLSTLLGGPATPGEILPATTRALNFRLTVRDNRPHDGRSGSADLALAVTAEAGPFRVTLPNTALGWGRGETRLVRWDAANTQLPPVDCTTVDIALSTDGGTTYPRTLYSGAPNRSQAATVTVPAIPDTPHARVRVQCATNVFFDISDSDFSIGETGTPDPDVDAIFSDGFESP